MKSTLAITAGCLLAAFSVSDTVNRVTARLLTPRPLVATHGTMGDISKLTGQEDESADKNLDDLFASKDATRDGLDADELASIRELARVAVPHSSDWGSEFYKSADGSVGGVSPSTLRDTTSAWDGTLGQTMASSATSGPLSYFSSSSTGGSGIMDQFALASNDSVSSAIYGGDAGGAASGGGSTRARTAAVLSAVSTGPVAAIPEPTSISLIALGAGMALRRRTRRA